ncbi:MAG TPA: TlpA disulfide reductase family protein [Thermoanaerobaculia bacterium]|nr:TlpA disulfide reductase family protein [Thermoanaerobaculia bacterium]
MSRSALPFLLPLFAAALLAGSCGRERQNEPPEQVVPAAAPAPEPSVPFPAVGSRMPSFVANTLDGQPVDLSRMKGKVVLVNIWATWCGPCRAEIPELQALYEREKEHGLEVVGISIDSAAAKAVVRAFVDSYKIGYQIVLDPDGRSAEVFATNVIPTSALIDRTGKVLWYERGMFRTSDPRFASALAAAF